MHELIYIFGLMTPSEHLLVDLEKEEPGRLMSRNWMRVLVLICILTILYSLIISYLNFKLVEDISGGNGMWITIIGALFVTFIIAPSVGLLLASLFGLIPIAGHSYSQRFVAIGLVIILLLQLLLAVSFTQSYQTTRMIQKDYMNLPLPK